MKGRHLTDKIQIVFGTNSWKNTRRPRTCAKPTHNIKHHHSLTNRCGDSDNGGAGARDTDPAQSGNYNIVTAFLPTVTGNLMCLMTLRGKDKPTTDSNTQKQVCREVISTLPHQTQKKGTKIKTIKANLEVLTAVRSNLIVPLQTVDAKMTTRL